MGHTYAKIKIYSPYLSRSDEAELLVDTGSTYTWIDGGVLERLGVKVRKVWRFRAIDGRIIERRIGDALVECMGEQAPTVVVFAEKGDGKVLGFTRLRG